MSLMRSSLLLDLDAEAVGVDVDLDHLAQSVARPPPPGAVGCRRRLGGDDAGVQGGAAGHHLADRQRLVRRLAAQVLQHLPRHRHVRRAAHQQHAVHLLPVEAGLTQQLLHGQPRADQQVARQVLELRPAQRHGQHLAAVRAGDGGLGELAEGALGALGGGLEGGERLRVGARVGADLLQELGGDVVDDAVVPVLAAEADVALDGQRLEALFDRRTSVTSKVPPPRS